MKMRKLEFTDEEWDEIREHAHNRNGMTVTEYLRAGHHKMKTATASTAGVRPVTQLGGVRRATNLRERTMYECSVKDCGFHTAVNRACPRHPNASLKKVS